MWRDGWGGGGGNEYPQQCQPSTSHRKKTQTNEAYKLTSTLDAKILPAGTGNILKGRAHRSRGHHAESKRACSEGGGHVYCILGFSMVPAAAETCPLDTIAPGFGMLPATADGCPLDIFTPGFCMVSATAECCPLDFFTPGFGMLPATTEACPPEFFKPGVCMVPTIAEVCPLDFATAGFRDNLPNIVVKASSGHVSAVADTMPNPSVHVPSGPMHCTLGFYMMPAAAETCPLDALSPGSGMLLYPRQRKVVQSISLHLDSAWCPRQRMRVHSISLHLDSACCPRQRRRVHSIIYTWIR